MALAPVAPLVLGCQAGEFAMRYGPTVMQLASQWADKLPAVGDWLFSSANSAEQAGHSAGQNAGNTTDPGGIDPKDPFQNASDTIRKGVNTLRAQANNVRNYYQYRLGARATLARAEHYQTQGTLRSVDPVGNGTIDLLLNNSTGVEVKYWSAQYALNNVRPLAEQIQGFSNLNLNQITIEFVQTVNNPVTQSTINKLQQQLVTQYGANLSNIIFTIVSNPGIR
jgi:hypothetical protein